MVSDHFVDVTKMIELGKSGIKPEQLLPEEDIKKLERRVASTDKGVEKKKWKSRKQPSSLKMKYPASVLDTEPDFTINLPDPFTDDAFIYDKRNNYMMPAYFSNIPSISLKIAINDNFR